MAGLYHINGDSVSPCRAQKGQCPFGKGEVENHFESANKAMEVLEERLSHEYGNVNSVSKKAAPPASAKELAAKGGSEKEVRDALRRENPSWDARRVHTVQQQMTKGEASSTPKASKAPAVPTPAQASPQEVRALHRALTNAKEASKHQAAALRKVYSDEKAYDAEHGVAEGRAYHYDYSKGWDKVPGPNPGRGGTSYNRHSKWVAARQAEQAKYDAALKAERDAQTAIEEAGFGHTIPDEGNTVRVRTQAQKWLLENELKGQISDGMWENASNNPWEDWSSAKVIVDPRNAGRNFNTRKDNYQLNSKALLDAVGDRMVEDVRKQTGKDYNEKAMMNDLTDLRRIFKTKRNPV